MAQLINSGLSYSYYGLKYELLTYFTKTNDAEQFVKKKIVLRAGRIWHR